MKKFLPYILILAIFLGILSPLLDVHAQAAPSGDCTYVTLEGDLTTQTMAKADCDGLDGDWVASQETPADPNKSAFQNQISENSCGFNVGGVGSGTFYPGCFIQASYALFYVIPAFALWAAGQFFNVLISMTLYSNLTSSSTFVSNAWVAVRDISNLFFILILLYVAVELTLGLAHDAKKVIVQVILMALLINFSMFFTEIIIDGTNLLALVFYNKVSVQPLDSAGKPIVNYSSITGEKDVAGGLVTHFDATRLLDDNFFSQVKKINPPGVATDPSQDQAKVPPSILIGITVVAGLIMGYAAYCFFTVGVLFMSRLIELWILIIFSPFAFMSSSLPALSHVEGIGWDEWLSRLLSVSLMAPIFMFFLYLIFMMVKADPFASVLNTPNTSAIKTLLLIAIPALVILIILKKATAKAQKNAGELGTVLVGAAKSVAGAATGLAVGAATGGASLALSGTVGRHYQNVANDDELKKKAAAGDKGAQKRLARANSFAGKSFDLRDTGLGKFAAKKTGLDFNQGTGLLGLSTEELKGGRRAQEEHAKEKEIAKVKTYELSADAAYKQNELARDAKQPQNIRAKEFEEDVKKARDLGTVFNEKTLALFKRDYEKGDDLRKYGLDKVATAGSVDKIRNANEENQARRNTHAEKLEEKHHNDEDKNALRTLGDSLIKGAKASVSSPTNLAATVAIGAATGGLGLLALPFLHALKETLGHVHNTDAQVIAAVRKGEDKDKKLLNMIKEAGKGADDGHGHAAPAAAHGPAPAAHGPAAPAADHGPASHAPAPAAHAPADDHGGGGGHGGH